jgi:glycogen debranching enzyme
MAIADLLAEDGDRAASNRLRKAAIALREQVESEFWLGDEHWYAQALDPAKKPVPAITSNAGHLLWAGLPSPERASAMAKRVRRPDLWSGWGVRTLATGYPTFNPMSYHNGSVWPHDTSLVVAGLAGYGHRDVANDLGSAIIEAAYHFPMARLPEVYCGFTRDGRFRTGPAEYLVANSPQAWSAATPYLLLQSFLGLRVGSPGSEVVVDPALPGWLERLELHGLWALGRRRRVAVRRSRDGYRVTGATFRPSLADA